MEQRARTGVVGIGDTCIDHFARVGEGFLKEFKVKKGGSKVVSRKTFENALKKVKVLKTSSGGTIANALACFSLLGNKAAFVGKIGRDASGARFEKELRQAGVLPRLSVGSGKTAQVLCLITPDKERTFLESTGNWNGLTQSEVPLHELGGYAFLHFGAFAFRRNPLKSAVKKALREALKKGVKVSVDLGYHDGVSEKDKRFIARHSHIIFGNEEEVKSFFGVKDLAKPIKGLEGKTLVLKRGEKGVVAVQEGRVFAVPAVKPQKLIDTTGAGDAFTAGFLHELSWGGNVRNACVKGAVTASKIISRIGARPRNAKTFK